MIRSFLLFALSFITLGTHAQYARPKPYETDYTLVHTGATLYNIEHNNSFYKFSTSFNDEYIMAATDTLPECETLCTKKTRCLGMAHYYDENNSEICNLLTNLGDVVHTNVNVSSYKKVKYFQNTDLHSLRGKVLDTYTNIQIKNHTLYLDLNFNGVLDQGEPRNTTTTDGDFMFSNLSVNNYLIREIQDDNCIQLVPGVRGINGIGRGSGYVDNAVEYYYAGHHTNMHFNGGRITNRETGEFTRKTSVLWYSYNKRDDMFVSFYPEYHIVYAFVDEAIIDGPGTDIVVTTFLKSTTSAHISVSNNNVDFEYIGILNGSAPSPHNFDLGDINYDKHVTYVLFHFFDTQADERDHSDHKYEPLNIATIFGKRTSLAQPSFGIFSSVPQKEKDSLIFIKDCHYKWGCSPYCIFGNIKKSEIDSCMTGCNLWAKSNTCKCYNYKEYNVPFKGSNFSYDHCLDGCKYAINREIFPDYTLRTNTVGVNSHIIKNNKCNKTANQQCFLDDIEICSSMNNCSAISFNSTYYGMMFDSYEFLNDNSSIFLVKNEHLGDNELDNYKYTTSLTSTPTSTPSTSGTSTPTSTPSTSGTSTQTSTPSTSETSTPSTSETSTQTSTQTSTPSTSGTSTPSTSGTSTPSTSGTSTPTNITNNNTKSKVNLGPNIPLIIIFAVFMMAILLIGICHITMRLKSKKGNKHEYSYTNPIYAFNGNTLDRSDGQQTNEPNENIDSFYDDAVPPNENQLYTDVVPDISASYSKDQLNRYKLGLDPLPPFQTS